MKQDLLFLLDLFVHFVIGASILIAAAAFAAAAI